MNPKTLLIIALAIAAGSVLILTAQALLYKLAEVTAIIKPQTQPGVVLYPVEINLGTLGLGQGFSAYKYTTLILGPTGVGGNYTINLVIAIPADTNEWYEMVSGFQNLSLYVCIAPSGASNWLCTYNIPVVINGQSAINPGGDSQWWHFMYQQGTYAYYRADDYYSSRGFIWSLGPGNYEVFVAVNGMTAYQLMIYPPPSQIDFDINLYLYITPPAQIMG